MDLLLLGRKSLVDGGIFVENGSICVKYITEVSNCLFNLVSVMLGGYYMCWCVVVTGQGNVLDKCYS